jgi:hypothetical protein
MGNEASRQRGGEGNAASQQPQSVPSASVSVVPVTAKLPPPIKDPLYRSECLIFECVYVLYVIIKIV